MAAQQLSAFKEFPRHVITVEGGDLSSTPGPGRPGTGGREIDLAFAPAVAPDGTELRLWPVRVADAAANRLLAGATRDQRLLCKLPILKRLHETIDNQGGLHAKKTSRGIVRACQTEYHRITSTKLVRVTVNHAALGPHTFWCANTRLLAIDVGGDLASLNWLVRACRADIESLRTAEGAENC